MLTRRFLLLGVAALSGCGPASAFDAPAGGPARNAVVLRNSSLAAATDHPLRLGRPFVQGEIRGAPQVLLGGTPLPTQADVKTRWPDGSVQHAVLWCIVPHIPPAGSVTLTFADAAPQSPAAPAAASLLQKNPDFDAAIRIVANGQSQSASARAMLAHGDFAVWTAGPIAISLVLADHSAARRWDIGPAPLRPLRPIFHATFWPTINRVELRAIGEVACTEALADFVCDIQITAGATAPREVYRQAAVTCYAATRWTRRFWLGETPATLAIDHNLAWLAATRAFPNFDTGLGAPERAIGQDLAHWEAAPRGFYEAGLWDKAMPSTGGRPDIGPYPAWVTRWLFSGDARQGELVSGMADLAGAWPLHVREGNPQKRFDAAGKVPALGRPLSIYARPTLWLLDPRDPARPEDRVRIAEPRILTHTYPKTGGGWANDGGHQPDPYSALYTLTGDYFALEQLQFWAASQAVKYDPAYKGPPPSGAISIHEQVRGSAWVLRNRVHAAFLSPDGTPEKAYFTALVDDAVACWEGVHGVTGTQFQGSRLWQFGQSMPYLSPLHMFGDIKAGGGEGLLPDRVSTVAGLWQHYMLIFELGRAAEKGFPTGKLLAWLAVVLTGQFQDPDYDPRNLVRYYTPARDLAGAFFARWRDALAPFKRPTPPVKPPDVGDGYGAYAYAASTMIVREPGGAEAYRWLREHYYAPLRNRYAENPKWAFLPRA